MRVSPLSRAVGPPVPRVTRAGPFPAAADRGLAGAELFVDPIQDAVDEPAGLLGAELLRHLDGLVDGHLGRDVRRPEQLEDAGAEDVAIHHGHPLQVPVLGVLGDQLVDLLPVEHRPPQKDFTKRAHLGVPRVPVPELLRGGGRIRLPPQIELVEELQRHLPRLPALTHGAAPPGTRIPPSPGPPAPLPPPGSPPSPPPAPRPALR